MTLKEFIEKLQTLPPEVQESKVKSAFYDENFGDKFTITFYKKVQLQPLIISTKLQ